MIIIYDNSGKIWYNGSGNGIPNGLPYLDITIPDGKYVEKIDTTGNEPKPVFKEYPKSEMDILKETVAEISEKVSTGTRDNPILWVTGMTSYLGKFYKYNGKIYECIRDSVNPLYYTPDVLIASYFSEVIL